MVNNLNAKLDELNTIPKYIKLTMFAVDCHKVKEELINEVNSLKAKVIENFTDKLNATSSSFCKRYEDITKRFQQNLTTVEHVVSMEQFKNTTAFELIKMNESLYENRKNLFVLINLNIRLSDETRKLFCDLHQWPSSYNKALDTADLLHANERAIIEEQVRKRKDIFEAKINKLSEDIKEVYESDSYKLFDQAALKCEKFYKVINEYTTDMQSINNDENLLTHCKTSFEVFITVRETFIAYYEFWTSIFTLKEAKKQWTQAKIKELDIKNIDNIIRQSIKTSIRSEKGLKNDPRMNSIINEFKSEIEEMNKLFPTIEILTNIGLKERHWKDIKEIINLRATIQ
jgi:dynein heavy chain, axonemal